jgi:hypothetical protein
VKFALMMLTDPAETKAMSDEEVAEIAASVLSSHVAAVEVREVHDSTGLD